MKFLAPVCFAILFSCNTAIAAIDLQSLGSNINRIEIGHSRNKPDMMNKAYADVMAAIAKDITDNKAAVKKASGSEKAMLQESLTKEEKLYSEVETLGADKQKNAKEIVSKLRNHFKSTTL